MSVMIWLVHSLPTSIVGSTYCSSFRALIRPIALSRACLEHFTVSDNTLSFSSFSIASLTIDDASWLVGDDSPWSNVWPSASFAVAYCDRKSFEYVGAPCLSVIVFFVNCFCNYTPKEPLRQPCPGLCRGVDVLLLLPVEFSVFHHFGYFVVS